MNKIIPAIMFIIILLGGLGYNYFSEETTEETIIKEPEYIYFFSAHQFNQSQPAAYGETIEYNLTNDTQLNLSLYSRFHEPMLWSQGSITINVIFNETAEVIWTHKTSESTQENYNFSVNRSGLYKFEFLADGSNDSNNDDPGDAYIAEFNLTLWK
jgi:hypothetical protein